MHGRESYRAVMGYFKDRRVAEYVAQLYTDRGHKQLYGVEEAPDGTP